MLKELTMPEVVVATALCLFAMGTARAADSTATERNNDHRIAIAHADADSGPSATRTNPGRENGRGCAPAGNGRGDRMRGLSPSGEAHRSP